VPSRSALEGAAGDAFYYDSALRMTVVKIMDTRSDVMVTVTAP
jgi:hypothetical protein